MFRRLLLSLSLLTLAVCALAQSGTIKGNVKDAVSGEAIIGANVLVMGTAQGAQADIEGNFEIPKVKAGTYSIVVSFISYKTDTLKDITVYPDQTTMVNATIMEEGHELTEVVITGAKVTNTDVSVITEIRKSDLVAVGISAQQISLSQDRDAAQIVKRIPGVTIINNRFINVRGLSERYSTVMLNGVIAPSSEVDSKAFAFDLIPSSMIDRMLVYKSGSAELSGEFAGAVVNIETKSVVDENSLSVNITGGYRLGTTFDDFYTYQGSNTDWLGFDNGTRQLPSSFPGDNLSNYLYDDASRQKLTDASRSLPNIWGKKKTSAMPDLRTTINFSQVGSIGSKRLSNITSLSYTNTRQHIEQENYYYDRYVASEQKSDRRYFFNDVRDMTNVRLGVISNFTLELNPANKIEFRNLFNQQGMSQVTSRTGIEDFNQYENNNLALNYMQRGIYTGQLSGKHSVNDRLSANWILAYSNTSASQPDYRRIRSQRQVGSTDPFAIVLPPNSGTQDAGRFYSDLNENVYTHALNLEYKLNPDAEESKQSKIQGGYYIASTDRDFKARWFAYGWSNLNNQPSEILDDYTFETIFAPQNIGFSTTSGTAPYFILKEGTNFSDAYTGNNLLTAGYLSTAIPVGDFRVAAGVRVEYNKQELSSFDTNGRKITVDNPVTSILPFLNVAYNLSDKNLIRLAYSKTINRPVFRELAPFNFYDFDRNANIYGNKDLKTADIHNVDLRWENYPSKSESISFGVFYKYFQNPIETELVGGSNLIYTYRNASSARNFGAEVEIRKSFETLFASSFLKNFSVMLNAAVIDSEIDLGNVTNQEQKRAMQGQSPYIINAGLNYNDFESGWQANVSYNVFGKRIFAVGDLDQNATQYEMPRNQIDLTVSKSFSEKVELKFGIQDILNQKYRLIQDSDRSKSINDIDEPIQNYKPGQYITLGVTYKIY
jgi:TonB-dependent receptor